MFIDPLVYIGLAPAVLVPLWARVRVAVAMARARRRRSTASGAEAAAAILGEASVAGVAIVAIDGALSDLYDPTHRTLRLSTPVHDGRSLASLAIALREAGHAIRHARRPWSTVARFRLTTATSIGVGVAWMVVVAGFVLDWPECLVAGLLLVALIVASRLAILPIERAATRRALTAWEGLGGRTEDDRSGVISALDAASLAPLAAILPLPFGPLHGLARRRRNRSPASPGRD